jgi:endo-1,3(4)-beta-glucanase
MHIFLKCLITLIVSLSLFTINAQTTNVGNGSYTNSFPGVDIAGRNGYPNGAPQLSGAAQYKPVPTNDWWSYLLKENHVSNLFNYPLTMRTTSSGLGITYVPFGVVGDKQSVNVGVQSLNSSRATVSNHTDWTVTMEWSANGRYFTATSGIGMPFVYLTKGSSDLARVEVMAGSASVHNEMILIENAQDGVDYAVYAPVGSSWSQSGNVFTSSLNNEDYWSVVMLPQENTNALQVANTYKKFAYVFPSNTTVTWNYNESTSVLRTDFEITADVKEGTHTTILQGLLPHQWSHLASNSPAPNRETYASVRGDLKMLDGNTFATENTFYGILPTLPYLANYSNSFNPSDLVSKVDLLEIDALPSWTDSYNEGQLMNRLVQTARIAHKIGNIEARDKMIATVKERLEDWLSYEAGEVAFLFYYNNTWSTLFGYPAGHGQDTNINDHHFHWGYFIHAAAFVEQFEPGWTNQWGDMINLLVRDAASSNRNDDTFPFLRSFSPYAGHAWANGFATFPQGNDQESTSESMQFNSSLIHWGAVTGNDAIRDLGIYLYTTEQAAVEEYWFDVHERIFSDTYQYSIASRVWGNSYDSGTFWTADIAAAYGIEMYPIHGGSLYLGHNATYVQKLWNEMQQNTGILSNQENANLWHDVYWCFAAFVDPDTAIELYDSYPDRGLKFGISDAHTYYWLHNMKALGTVKTDITANHPIAAAFEQNDNITYVAHNYSNAAIDVDFSDGFSLSVPAFSMSTNRDVALSGTISSSFDQAYSGGSVDLTVEATGNGITKIEFFNDDGLTASDTTSPYTTKIENLTTGIHNFYAKVYNNSGFAVTNSVEVVVGAQKPYLNQPFQLPGTIQSGNYDYFEGGQGQGISYFDTTLGNNGAEFGSFRLDESVDAVSDTEGKTVGWIEAGEWLEYSVDVSQSGYYKMDFRYASNNASSGPFHLELDGQQVGNAISLSSTGDWDQWATKSVTGIPLLEGVHVLKVAIDQGGFNLGEMTFTRISDLDYTPLIAEAGANITVEIPATTAQLNGTQSTIPNPNSTNYQWEQVFGPTTVSFSDNQSLTTDILNLEQGIYKFELTLTESNTTAKDEVFVNVQNGSNALPSVTITSPSDGEAFVSGNSIEITTTASDFDGTVSKVEFFDGATKLGEDTSQPYAFSWVNPTLGSHNITAKVTDNDGGVSTSAIVNIYVNQRLYCTFKSNDHIDGSSFSTGYNLTFETIGTNVTFSAELLDSDKSGVVAYLFKQSPFGETQMNAQVNNVFTKTLGGFTQGEEISYAVKFAFAGGLSVTKYFQYEVGTSCTLGIENTEFDFDVALYPNPTSGKVKISSAEDVFVEVYDAMGRSLTASLNKTIDVSAYQSGIYFIKVTGVVSNRQQILKLIKK